MRKVYLFLFFITILLQFLFYISLSQSVLSILFEIYKNDSVKIDEIKVRIGNPTIFTIPGNYKLQILDKNKKVINETTFQPVFYILTDPPIETDFAVIHVRFLYDKNIEYRYLKIYKDEREIFSKEFSLCNYNKICDEYESYLSCPSDCPLDSRDGVCIKDRDGICDPDCLPGIDPDCVELKPNIICLNIKDGICDENCIDDPDCIIETTRFPIWIIFIIIIIISLFLFIHYYKKVKYIKKL
ncbi:MAG: hypothetical protein QXX04_01060 [Candidatus Aenigmatarchaeota archaeon]